MRISVVMPTLDEEALLPSTLAHILLLAFDELLIVDGGSRDRTREIIEPSQPQGTGLRQGTRNTRQQATTSHEVQAPCPVILLTSPPGRAQQMNAGAKAATGEVLLFLHADTRLPANAREAIVAALHDRTCVGGRFDVRFNPDSGWRWLISRTMNLRSRWTGIATGDQAMFVRREVFERLGGFADLPIMEDVEFSRRLKRAGCVAALRETAITSDRRWARKGPIGTILLMWALRFMYWVGTSPHVLTKLYGPVR